MTSKLSAEIIRTIVEQRSQLAGRPTSTQQFLESVTQQAEHLLSYGLTIAVHVSLVPLKCQCSQKVNEECQQSVEFEVWTIQLEKNQTSGILPMFLQKAVLSQLHFSPFNAWLSDKHNGSFPDGYRCIYRLSTNSKFSSPKSTTSHSFPSCSIDSKDSLKVTVEWLCKNEILEPSECLPLKKINNTLKEEPIVIPIQKRPVTEPHSLTAFKASSSQFPNLLLEKKRIRRNTTGSETSNSGQRNAYKGSPVPWAHNEAKPQKPLNKKSGLLCNFEESALKGRLEPINQVDGFKIQLIIQDRFNPASKTIPLNAYFFNISDDNTPSLYLGHCSLNESGRKPIRIGKQSTIQATLFNPQGSVVKIFIVPIDVRDIPASSKTFIRQRTYCMPNELPIEEVKRSWLRYLIHFRLITDRHGRLYIHTDIRMLFSNKDDLDVQNLASGKEFQLVTKTESPQEPKYSTIK